MAPYSETKEVWVENGSTIGSSEIARPATPKKETLLSQMFHFARQKNVTARGAHRYQIGRSVPPENLITTDEFEHGSRDQVPGERLDMAVCALNDPQSIVVWFILSVIFVLCVLFALKKLGIIEFVPRKPSLKPKPRFSNGNICSTECGNIPSLSTIKEIPVADSPTLIEVRNPSSFIGSSAFIYQPAEQRSRKLSHVSKFPISTAKLQSYISPMWTRGPRKRSFENSGYVAKEKVLSPEALV